MSKFQIILMSVFGAFIVIAVIIFSFSRGGGAGSATVVIWGDIPKYDFDTVANEARLHQDNSLVINYVEKSPSTLESAFTEALAIGRGPDLIIISLDQFYRNKNKLIPIPYGSISEGDFKSTFLEEGELFLATEGVYALPLFVDPLVLYYNRDILSNNSVAKPVSFWDEMYATALTLTDRDPAGNIIKSAIALGESQNIPHSKDILSLLMLQAGTPITKYVSGELRPTLNQSSSSGVNPTEAALDFYTQFSNPAKPYFSWNRSLLPAETHFTSGDTAYYLGYASELRSLRSKNPTLNVAVALVPQSRISSRSITLGALKGVAITTGTRNPPAALSAALKLVTKDVASALSQTLVLPPARRDLLSERQADDVLAVFYTSALQSRGWIDPNAVQTRSIFNNMIDSVTSGRARTSEAVNRAQSELESLIP